MVSYKIALNFEDGVTRFVECGENEKVLDAAFRNRVNLPMDCSDGVCGTCKCRAESGTYDLGDDFIDDALTADEARQGLVLTCQMKPSSDCVIAVPATSAACKTGTRRLKQRSRASFPITMPRMSSSWTSTIRHLRRPSCRGNMSISRCPRADRRARIPSVLRPADARVSFPDQDDPRRSDEFLARESVRRERLQLTGPLAASISRSAAASAASGRRHRACAFSFHA